MPSEVVKHFYEEVKFLAEKIGELKITNRFIEAAKSQNPKRVENTFEKFKSDNSELWERFSKLYEDYEKERHPVIFYEEDTENFYKYDPSEIDPLNLCFVFMFSHFIMSDDNVFYEIKNLQDALYEKGHKELADYMEHCCINALPFDLIHAFGEE